MKEGVGYRWVGERLIESMDGPEQRVTKAFIWSGDPIWDWRAWKENGFELASIAGRRNSMSRAGLMERIVSAQLSPLTSPRLTIRVHRAPSSRCRRPSHDTCVGATARTYCSAHRDRQ